MENFMRKELQLLFCGIVSCLTATPSMATSLSGMEVLQQFNLVVFGDAHSASHVDGRTYIGGNLNGGDYVQHAGETPASNYAGLTVAGNAAGVHVNGLGAVVRGNISSSTINTGNAVVLGVATNSSFNGSYRYYAGSDGGGNQFNSSEDLNLANDDTVTSSTSTDFLNKLTSLSDDLKSLRGNSTFDISGNKVTFHASADSNGMATFDISGSSIFASSILEYAFDVGVNVTSIIMNCDVAAADFAINFLGDSARKFGDKIIWNFYNAALLKIHNQFGGSILAVNADLANDNNIEGGVYVKTLNQRGEIHLQPYAGEVPSAVTPVPEPSMMLLFGVGLLGLSAVVQRKRN
jgi:choice-of-anchor A domain-containing protein